MFCAEPIYESQWPEHLIVSISLVGDLRKGRSAQRKEATTYHGDALPSELTGPGIEDTWSPHTPD